MEEHSEQSTIPTASAGLSPASAKFMDIQAPTGGEPSTEAQVATAPETNAAESEVTQASEAQPSTSDSSDNAVEATEPSVETPTEPTNIQVSDAGGDSSGTEAGPEPVTDIEPSSTSAETPPADHDAGPEHPVVAAKPHRVPVGAVVAAMLVVIALIGVVIFMFMRSRNANKLGTTTSSNSTATVEKPQASPEDIDQTTSQIDTTLSKIDDTADFSATAISDQSLGL